jgi:hypothetical protein
MGVIQSLPEPVQGRLSHTVMNYDEGKTINMLAAEGRR